jgi:Beta-ketoacyl synthase, N-terminal domain
MRPLYAYGCGYWSPGVPSWRARADNVRREAPHDPPCEAVPSRLLRGTSVVTRAAIEALTQAAREGGADLARVPTVFGSELGEVQTAIALLAQIRVEGVPSPMRFKNSVHNTASGTASIAWSNTAFSTALSAGDDLVAMALLEAWAYLDAYGGDLVVALAEEEIPLPLPSHGAYPSLAFGFHLGAEPRPGVTRLEALRVDASVPRTHPLEGGACGPAFGLLDAITQRRAATVSLSRDEGAPWCVDVRFEET